MIDVILRNKLHSLIIWYDTGVYTIAASWQMNWCQSNFSSNLMKYALTQAQLAFKKIKYCMHSHMSLHQSMPLSDAWIYDLVISG